jgi:hypothetical protein
MLRFEAENSPTSSIVPATMRRRTSPSSDPANGRHSACGARPRCVSTPSDAPYIRPFITPTSFLSTTPTAQPTLVPLLMPCNFPTSTPSSPLASSPSESPSSTPTHRFAVTHHPPVLNAPLSPVVFLGRNNNGRSNPSGHRPSSGDPF